MFLSKTRLSTRPKTALVSVGLCSNPDAVVVKVTDTGIGIGPEDLPHVLDRFWRADKSFGPETWAGLAWAYR